ncbi:hypothetical protein QVD17_40180 [Tagetes erecta]|uniref:Uncharacterized protein n=1 Tax=Tagetes erecta TaxID=13708 RepID=A0AAD8NAM5_TARER|nr:hypothetical protein QVD17_40180 [Tagetes erecta]
MTHDTTPTPPHPTPHQKTHTHTYLFHLPQRTKPYTCEPKALNNNRSSFDPYNVYMGYSKASITLLPLVLPALTLVHTVIFSLIYPKNQTNRSTLFLFLYIYSSSILLSVTKSSFFTHSSKNVSFSL